MRRFWIWILLSTMVQSCYVTNPPVVEQPEHLISRDEMISILTDLQLVEGMVAVDRENNKDVFSKGTPYAKEVFASYGISPAVFVENLNYYQSDEQVMTDIYEEILANLSTLEETVKQEIELEKLAEEQRLDSLMADSLRMDSLKIDPLKMDSLKPDSLKVMKDPGPLSKEADTVKPPITVRK